MEDIKGHRELGSETRTLGYVSGRPGRLPASQLILYIFHSSGLFKYYNLIFTYLYFLFAKSYISSTLTCLC